MNRTFIVQKYIVNPALYKGRKFDIRCYGMLTLVNGKLMGYVYDDGYLRTSSVPFNTVNLDNKLLHLTNDAVQNKSEEYGKFECGNKLSFSDYQQYLQETSDFKGINFRDDIFSQIKVIMNDTFKAVKHVIAPSRDKNLLSFEIFGFDFMLDDQMKVNLIEVNTNPCLETTAGILM